MSDEKLILPVKDAYKFGLDHGLGEEIKKIQSMEIEWDSSYSTTVRRGYIVELFSKNGIFDEFKDKHWPSGNTPYGIRKTSFFLRIKQRFEEFLQTGVQQVITESENSEEEVEQSFGAENDLRNFLEKNLGCVEKGLRLYDGDGRAGAEFSIDEGRGRIDLLAIDANGGFVVIELKLGRGRNKTLGQLLYYMGWVDNNLSKKPCRGIIIAKEIPDDLILAVKRVPGVSLCKYNLSVSVEPVSLNT